MVQTLLASATKEHVIGFDDAFTMIGERINPTGRKLFSKELKEHNYWRVKKEAIAQVEAGAQVLVAGSFVFNSEKPSDTITALKNM